MGTINAAMSVARRVALFLLFYPGKRELTRGLGCVAAMLSLFPSLRRVRYGASVLCCSIVLCCASGAVLAQARQAAPTYHLRVVGGLADVTQYTRREEPFWSKDLARMSGGRYTAEIVPFDRAGIPGTEMLRLMQLGVVPFGTALMSSFGAQYPEYTAPDLAGLNPDIRTLRATLAAFRPYLEKTLREQHGVEPLAIYVYPAQVVFCNKPMRNLSELAGRRVRVSSSTQADFVSALGAEPILTGFAQIVPSVKAGNMECAITGTMSGNTLGLYTLMSHVHELPINWGLAVFGANRAVWAALPAELRDLLQAELPKLEASIWGESERETADGLACNRGAPECVGGRKGRMVLAPVSSQDERLRQEIFTSTVLPRWLQRCGQRCTQVWNSTIGPVRGTMAPQGPKAP